MGTQVPCESGFGKRSVTSLPFSPCLYHSQAGDPYTWYGHRHGYWLGPPFQCHLPNLASIRVQLWTFLLTDTPYNLTHSRITIHSVIQSNHNNLHPLHLHWGIKTQATKPWSRMALR